MLAFGICNIGKPLCIAILPSKEFGPMIFAHPAPVDFKQVDRTSNSTYKEPGLAWRMNALGLGGNDTWVVPE
ncbi:hypothetical protein ACFOLJ_10505 [Rugamonas sp. CCM 8940]|uniref:hypothetical protein n=1 Tax=Rugamonas sp. CCM 8940 TaxID=2765359 RepID=UPI0018F3F6E2|nr:hypothetical protein [Rugamonas sp. CCM 8940]MBJ7309816.1 hypothetical protein [Rugamonas sp. CCM 8940]